MARHERDDRNSRDRALSEPRALAIEVLRRIDVDGAWASRALDAELRRHALSPRDAALAAEIVYGVLRVQPDLDRRIDKRLKKKGKLDPLARAALRVGAYQLRHLSRVPPHAALDTVVTAVRQQRGKRVGGFVNAILRRLAEERPEAPASPTRVELPRWLGGELRASLGDDRAEQLCASRPVPPPVDIRVTVGEVSELERRLAEAGIEVSRIPGLPKGLRTRRGGDARSWPGFDDGRFVVQEAGSQLVAALVGAAPGERIADVCAGRGGKTTALAEAVGSDGTITAFELHESRLEQIPAALAQVGLSTPVELVCADLSVGTAGFEGAFDRVLVDAPCTGVGTFHRRPEILRRLRPEHIAELATLQTAILSNSAKLLRPGGELTFAVCSPLAAEGDAIAAGAAEMGLRATSFGDIHEGLEDAPGVVRIGPWTPGLAGDADAYQVFRFVR